MIPWKQKVLKHSKCSISIEKLLQETGYSKEKSDSEFELTIVTIQTDISNSIPVTGIRILEKLYEANIC